MPDIHFAKPADYRKARVTIRVGPDVRSAMLLLAVAAAAVSG